MLILKTGVQYFALVFGAGFVLGTIRTLWVTPHLGTRTAELLEMPIMLWVTILAAGWIVRRYPQTPTPSKRLSIGLVALGLLLAAEFGLAFVLRRVTGGGYVANRDPITTTAFVVLLGVFAAMPLLVARRGVDS